MSENIPFVYQTTVSSELPPQDRYEQWLMPMIYGFEVLPPDQRQKLDFSGRVKSLITDTSEIHDVATDSFGGFLSEKRSSADLYDKLALLYVINGNIKCCYKDDTDIVAKSGEFVLFNARQAHQMHFNNARFVQLNLPRFAAQNYLTNNFVPSQISNMVSCSGLAGILGLQLKHFYKLSDDLTTAEKLVFLQNTENLALSLIKSLTGNKPNLSGTDQDSVFLAAVHYIEANLSLDCLSPKSIAIALGCSRTTLYRAFARQNLYPADYIRDQRLRKFAQSLQMSNQTLTIAQLASECGLYDVPNLSRLFKRKFELSPQDYRASYL